MFPSMFLTFLIMINSLNIIFFIAEGIVLKFNADNIEELDLREIKPDSKLGTGTV